ncbi:MAG: tetratricopeptide repeat protein, partial [Bdellovibrionales bacterium]|nr:tetratricopeptide repeat protein [Bdellovibrionales bacterium]
MSHAKRTVANSALILSLSLSSMTGSAIAGLALTLALPSVGLAQSTAAKGIDQLQTDLEKINRSIETTKEKVKSVKDARFLPDLYFTLAELYVDQSRYMYQIKVVKNKKTPLNELDFANERRPKLLAIETYQMILEKFPNIPERDKALFYMAHEFRELGRNDEMASTYQRLVKEFPRSQHWSESQLMLGNYFFESKKDFEFALGLYGKIVSREDSGPFIPLARYKMGWVYINLSKFKEALLSFEAVLTQDKKVDLSLLPEIYRKTDVRRDALVSMVRPFSELKPEELNSLGPERRDPLKYFMNLSPERASYQKVLRVLGRRLIVKGKFVPATRAYFELLRLSGDTETRMEAIDKLYESLQNAKVRWPVNFLVDEIATTLIRIKSNRRIPAKEREKIMINYEVIARDAATRFQERAESTKQPADYRAAVHAYDVYLELFPTGKKAELIRQNLAESLYKLGLWVPAGRMYETTAATSSSFSAGRKGGMPYGR